MEMSVVYGAGWDAAGQKFVGVMSLAEARRRDAGGEPYSVMMVSGSDLVAVLDRHGVYLSVWLFDGLRRSVRFEFRQLKPGWLMLRAVRMWRYADGDPEFGPAVRRRSLVIDMEQRLARGTVEPKGDAGSRSDSFYAVDLDRLWQPVPVLDDPLRLVPAVPLECMDVRRLGPWGKPPPAYEGWWRMTDNPEAWAPADPDTLTGLIDHTSVAVAPWRAPQPLAPADFRAWFVDGHRFSLGGDETGRIRVVDAGVLHVPTGRLMAAEPGWSAGPCAPFTVAVPPGEYPVSVALIDWDNGCFGHAAAMRLMISAADVVGWEMALRDGQDQRLLDDREFYGFGVDGGMASLFDIAAYPVIEAMSGDDYDNDTPYERMNNDGFAEMTLPGVAANIIGVVTAVGDGAYPTWFGRAADGTVATVLVDLELLREATFTTRDM